MSQMQSGDFAFDEAKTSSNTLGLVGFILAFCVSPLGFLLSLIALRKAPRGFAIAGVLIGLLGTVIWAGVGYFGFKVGGAAIKASQTSEALVSAQSALEASKTPGGEYPSDLSGIAGGTDAWGHAFEYERAEDGKGYLLVSKGADGQAGTADDIRTMQGMDKAANMVLAMTGAGGDLMGGLGNGQAGQGIMLVSGMVMISMSLDRQLSEHGTLPEKLDEIPGMPKSVLVDPWGSAFVYARAEDGKSYLLKSNGPDKQPGTGDDMDSEKVTGDFKRARAQARDAQKASGN